MTPFDSQDEAVLALLADTYGRLDPVPAGLTDEIKFALTVQALQAEVAEIVETESIAVRGPHRQQQGMETVTFTAGRVSLMVSPTVVGDLVRIDGWVTRGGAQVEVHGEGLSRIVVADVNGRFVFEDIPRGTVLFVVRLAADDPDETPVVTPRIEL